jgi:hypothetical protein
MGLDHPYYLQTCYMRTRIEAALRDKNHYHDAKQRRSLNDLHELQSQWSGRIEPQTLPRRKDGSQSLSKDWRLDNVNKARWWASVELEQEARENIDSQSETVEHLVEHVWFLQDVQDGPDRDYFIWSPYGDIMAWFHAEETQCKLGRRRNYPARFTEAKYDTW